MSRLLSRRWLAIALISILTLLLAGCSGAPIVTSWPGMVVRANTAYVASSDQIYALDILSNTVDSKRLLQGWPVKPLNSPGLTYHGQPALSPDGKTMYLGADSVTGNSGAVFAISDVSPGPSNVIAVKWTYPVTQTDVNPGNVYGGVVLVSDTVYFAGGSGLLFALDAETGSPRWNKPFDPGTNVRIWSTPAVDGNLVFVASQDHHLYAVNKATGDLAWKFPKDGAPTIGTLAGSPAVYNGTVYVGSFDTYLYAVDLNGDERWRFKAGASVWDPPAEVDGVLYFGDLDGNVYALSAANGQPTAWPQTAKVDGGVRATPLVADGVVYVGTDLHKMYALDAATGRAIWQAPFTARDGEMLLVTPVLDGNTLVVLPNLAGANPTRLYVLNKATGAQLWQYPPVTQ